MATIREMLERFESLNLRESVPTIIQEQEAILIDYNQSQLFEKSIDADGNPLREYRNEFYAIEKNKMNPAPGIGNPDLKYTGAFYKGFRADVDEKTIRITSDDMKSDKLVKEYGERIFGLTMESKSRYAKGEFLIALKNWIESKTKLKFG